MNGERLLPRERWISRRTIFSGLALVFLLLTSDALFRNRGEFDYDLMRTVQRISFPGDHTVLHFVDELTSQPWAVYVWLLAVVGFFAAKRYLVTMMLFAFPIAGGINVILRDMIGRSRPHPGVLDSDRDPVEVARIWAQNDFVSYPSGHVIGAVLLWGFFFVLAGELRWRPIRWGVQAFSVAVIVLIGVARVWIGSHWVGDVLAGYAFGGAFLLKAAAVGDSASRGRTGGEDMSIAPIRIQTSFRPSARGVVLYGHLAEERVRWLARFVGAIAIVLFGAVALREGIPRSVLAEGWEVTAQIAVLALVLVSYLIAFRWEGLGGAGMIISAAILGTIAAIAYAPGTAVLALLVFLVPGGLFLFAWQRRATLLSIWLLSLGVFAVLGSAGVAAQQVYNYYYGPTHPSSDISERPFDLVEFAWAGALTPDGFQVKAKLADGVANPALLVAPVEGAGDAKAFAPTSVSERGITTFEVDGLAANTAYTYRVEAGGRIEQERVGRITTAPEGEGSFTIALGSCIGTGSNGQVFDRIREANPLLFLVGGDFQYENISVNDYAAFAAAYEKNLGSPAQQELYLNTSFVYTWDDHDWGGDGSNRTAGSAPAAHAAYREFAPHYALQGEATPIYHAFTIGRVRFIVTDTRAGRSPVTDPDDATKTMLGAEQKEWFKQELLAANGVYPLIVWVNPVPWIAAAEAGADHWGGYTTERAELANFIADNGIEGLAMLSGDAHALAIDDGTNSNFSDAPGEGFPVFHAAALDRRGREKGGPYSEGIYPGGGQFGLMTVTDDGDGITVEWRGMNWKGEEIVSLTFTP